MEKERRRSRIRDEQVDVHVRKREEVRRKECQTKERPEKRKS